MIPPDLARLEALERAALAVERFQVYETHEWTARSLSEAEIGSVEINGDFGWRTAGEAADFDAALVAYLAALDPQTVLSLLAQAREAERWQRAIEEHRQIVVGLLSLEGAARDAGMEADEVLPKLVEALQEWVPEIDATLRKEA